MKNPCKECLLINNCTAICEAKKNYKTLLEHALSHFGSNRNRIISAYDRKLQLKWIEKLTETNLEIGNILSRAAKIKLKTTI